MPYDFMGKIKEAKNEAVLDIATLNESILEIGKSYHKPLTIKVIQSEKSPRDLLVKSQISVTSLPGAHVEDLTNAINAFKHYMDEIALLVNGQVNRSEGFYNNDRTFYPLY